MNITARRRSLIDAIREPVMHRGVLEGYRGERLDPDRYRTRADQFAYEQGRLWGVALRASGYRLPPWIDRSRVPPGLRAALRAVSLACGSPWGPVPPSSQDAAPIPAARKEPPTSRGGRRRPLGNTVSIGRRAAML